MYYRDMDWRVDCIGTLYLYSVRPQNQDKLYDSVANITQYLPYT